MVTRQRSDLLVNIPALRKLDAMLIVSYGFDNCSTSSNGLQIETMEKRNICGNSPVIRWLGSFNLGQLFDLIINMV